MEAISTTVFGGTAQLAGTSDGIGAGITGAGTTGVGIIGAGAGMPALAGIIGILSGAHRIMAGEEAFGPPDHGFTEVVHSLVVAHITDTTEGESHLTPQEEIRSMPEMV